MHIQKKTEWRSWHHRSTCKAWTSYPAAQESQDLALMHPHAAFQSHTGSATAPATHEHVEVLQSPSSHPCKGCCSSRELQSTGYWTVALHYLRPCYFATHPQTYRAEKAFFRYRYNVRIPREHFNNFRTRGEMSTACWRSNGKDLPEAVLSKVLHSANDMTTLLKVVADEEMLRDV